jgi:hypothetical protein
MADKADEFRTAAARCLEQARLANDPEARQRLIDLAARYHRLAGTAQSDLDNILAGLHR